jgi:hypothetical protein
MQKIPHLRAVCALGVTLAALSAVTAVAATSPSTAATHLATFLVRSGDVSGYAPAGSATRFTTATAWGGKKTPLTTRLVKEGFVAAASEYTLYTPKGGSGGGISWALELSSAASASSELAADYKQLAVGSMGASVVKRYSLPGIRNSRAWTTEALGFQAANVLYPEGRCVLLIGIERTLGGTLSNVMTPLQTAAQSIYKRTHATCP